MVSIHPIGLYQELIVLQTKYNFDFPPEVIAKNISRLTDQLWKLIPMRENEEDWKKQLNTVILEISGLSEIFLHNPLFFTAFSEARGYSYRRDYFFAIS